LHVSSVQGLLSSQTKVPAPGWQRPPPHVSPVVQGFPSSHGAVFGMAKQPEVGLQASSVQMLPSLHTIGVPLHSPPPQVSAEVQALPSSHGLVLFV
jgi:hypothetical protein